MGATASSPVESCDIDASREGNDNEQIVISLNTNEALCAHNGEVVTLNERRMRISESCRGINNSGVQDTVGSRRRHTMQDLDASSVTVNENSLNENSISNVLEGETNPHSTSGDVYDSHSDAVNSSLNAGTNADTNGGNARQIRTFSASAVKNPIQLHRRSIKLIRNDKEENCWNLEFDVDLAFPCDITILYGCNIKVKKNLENSSNTAENHTCQNELDITSDAAHLYNAPKNGRRKYIGGGKISHYATVPAGNRQRITFCDHHSLNLLDIPFPLVVNNNENKVFAQHQIHCSNHIDSETVACDKNFLPPIICGDFHGKNIDENFNEDINNSCDTCTKSYFCNIGIIMNPLVDENLKTVCLSSMYVILSLYTSNDISFYSKGTRSKTDDQRQFSYAPKLLEELSKAELNISKISQFITFNNIFLELQDIFGIGSLKMNCDKIDNNDSRLIQTEDDVHSGRECVICLQRPRSTLLLPCKHMCLCSGCAKLMSTVSDHCPICRQIITDRLQIILK